MDTTTDPTSSCPLERSFSQHSAASTRSIRSTRSNRSTTLRAGRSRRLLSQPNGSASSIAASDKSLTSFPSFSPDPTDASLFHNEEERLKTATQDTENNRMRNLSNRGLSIVDSLTGKDASRDALFEDAPLRQSIPGALHRADDSHIERLISRHGAVPLVRSIAEDLAQRDAQIAALRRRADERERALRKIVREHSDGENGLMDLMSDAMQDTMTAHAYGKTERTDATVRAGGNSKGTIRGWKEYLWGSGTAKRGTCASSVSGEDVNPATIVRSQSSMDRRPTIQDDLFTPPPEPNTTTNPTSSSRASSVHSAAVSERKSSVSLASLALRLVAGGTATPRDAEVRGRAVSASVRDASRAGSTASVRTAQSARVASMAGNPKALMAMRRTSQTPQALTSTKSQAQDMWRNMASSPPDAMNARQESCGPVEMDAILPPESQPPTLSHIYQNNAQGEFLTDRFGFIYDQRRKRRQREAAHMADQIKGGRTEMLTNGRTGISPNLVEGLPSPKWSVSSGGRPGSPNSHEERVEDDSKPKRWQDYLKIATFPTELLSHTPSVSASALEVLEGTGVLTPEIHEPEPFKGPSIPAERDANASAVVKEDTEPVKLLLEQLSDVHDALQRDKTVKWNDFLRKVRAERRREGQAAVAAAAAVAEARYETPAGNKGKVGRAKWNEFKSLVLGGIPVAFRAKVWSECSGANGLRVPGYYEDLVAQNGADDDAAVVSQIQMDIHRTLTDNIFFRKGPGVQKLNELLLAYSRRNKDVGYCQGMNLIAANLLLIMPSAEDAFWILASIIESILPHGYYDQSLMASRADQQVLRQFVSTVLPKLSAHLDSLSIELEALTFQWFLSVFTDCLCAEALFRVWDVVLCTNDGSTFLFQIALALLKLNEQNLLQCDTPAGVYTYINHHMTEHAISIDGLIQAGEALRRVVRREDIEQRRNKAIQAEKDMLAERESNTQKKTAQKAAEDEGLSVEEPRPDGSLNV
ncbi:hypothetical protein J3458_011698 [Metarhizium acridum]|uniref:uncharacterized protein n=1 Tax=Metarhizium acridum TaxID=92637 RepID=UPI001C6C0400|nr:hypothetical protein J3458_011698 [Metarhizium acridum]